MRSTQIVCDECGAVKKEANHWWILFRFPRQNGNFIGLGPNPGTALIADDLRILADFCSESCVQKTVSKYMRGEFKS